MVKKYVNSRLCTNYETDTARYTGKSLLLVYYEPPFMQCTISSAMLRIRSLFLLTRHSMLTSRYTAEPSDGGKDRVSGTSTGRRDPKRRTPPVLGALRLRPVDSLSFSKMMRRYLYRVAKF